MKHSIRGGAYVEFVVYFFSERGDVFTPRLPKNHLRTAGVCVTLLQVRVPLTIGGIWRYRLTAI